MSVAGPGGCSAAAFGVLLAAWQARHPPRAESAHGEAELGVVGVEVLRAGRPGLLSVIAELDGEPAHAVVGVQSPVDPVRPLEAGDDPVLGEVEDPEGTALAVDALGDAGFATMTLHTVTGESEPMERATLVDDSPESIEVTFDGRQSLTVYPWPYRGEHPGLTLLVALDRAGFNHLPAPVAVWRREGHDLGVVQELLIGEAGGRALALTSLRDLYASGLPPEEAACDFAPEAESLGTMTARMHVALAEAFGLHSAEAEQSVTALRTHGDFHLGRTARTDQGWVVHDCMPGGCIPGTNEPRYRSPLADVGDMLWSFEHEAAEAAWERDLSGRTEAAELGRSWHERNARAFLDAYLSTPGIEDLVPTDRQQVERLVADFKRARGAASQVP